MSKKHVFYYSLLQPLVAAFARIAFGYRCEKVSKDVPGPYIVLSNHTTDFDMLFVGSSFRKQMYFVGSEHIARWGFLYKLIDYFFAPIMRYKGTTAASTVMDVLRKVRGGDNICLFAEGARCWDGVTASFLPSTGKMVKSAKCSLITYRIEGGYFASPRWAGSPIRRGRMHGGPVNIYTAEQLAAMSPAEINAAITKDLHEDAYARQLAFPAPYRGKNLAEHMEKLLFLCPKCGAQETLSSKDDTVSCSACGLSFRYDRFGMLHGAPADTVKALAAQQHELVAKSAANITYRSHSAVLKKVAKHQETFVCEGPLSMNAEALTCGDVVIPFRDISDLTMHGYQTLVFSAGSEYYELIPAADTNAYKFHLLYQALKG